MSAPPSASVDKPRVQEWQLSVRRVALSVSRRQQPAEREREKKKDMESEGGKGERIKELERRTVKKESCPTITWKTGRINQKHLTEKEEDYERRVGKRRQKLL